MIRGKKHDEKKGVGAIKTSRYAGKNKTGRRIQKLS